MSMRAENRAYKRHSINWDAELRGDGFGPLAFVILDFCEGGLFLEPANKSADKELRRHLRTSDWVEVGLSDPVSGSRRQVRSQITRTTGRGFGLAFHSPQSTIVSALMTVAAGARSAASHELYAGDEPRSVSREQERSNHSQLSNCHKPISDYLASQVDSFITQADTLLTHSADDLANHREQLEFIFARNLLNSNRLKLISGMRNDILGYWDKLGRFSITPDTPEAGIPDQLSLVDEIKFEDWLARTDIITRAEAQSIRNLRLLHLRLSELAGCPVDEYRNPVSPAVLCHVFCRQIDALDVPHNIRLLIYPVYGRTALGQLNGLYDNLNSLLREAGILPDLEKNERLRVIKSSEINDPRTPTAQAGEPTQHDGPVQASETSPAPQTDDMPSQTAGNRPGHRGSLRELCRAQRNRENRSDALLGTVASAAPASSDALIRASETLRYQTKDQDHPLASRLSEALARTSAGNSAGLGVQQKETVELLDLWFTELRPDSGESAFFNYWSNRLKPLALQEELRSGAILDNRDHPVHKLVNALDLAAEIMAVSTDDERRKLQDMLSPTLEQAVDRFDGHPESLAAAASQMEHSLQRSQRLLESGMERVRQTCEGSQRLELARLAVELGLKQRLGGKAVPEPVLHLLEQGWRNHLVLVELRQGTASVDWTRGMRIIDILVSGMGSPDIPRRTTMESAKVLSYIQRRLLASNRPQPEVNTLISEIRHWLDRPADSRDMPPSRIFEAAEQHPDLPNLPQEWLGQAKLLRTGDWIQLRDESGRNQQLRLAWISRDRDRFVFVARNGQKAAELTLEALATQLGTHQADTGTDFNAPITERRWQEVLVNLNQQLVHTKTHDPLTGLLNRGTFQRRIAALLERSSSEQKHIFIHVALDDFKVVNNSLGHEGGDQALRQVGQLLVEGSGPGALIGRIGGDEFGILVAGCETDQGEAIADKHLLSIREHRFAAGGNSVKIAASISVVPFSRESHSIEDLLKDSDGMSVTAKKHGGNRLLVYSPGDAELQKLRESMSQATRIDQALDAGQLALRCQRIEPLQGTDDALPHYEVLVSLKGDMQGVIPPDHFIPAAERFGRMPALDRWVIREVLQWASRNPDRLQEIEGLSINLSGQSLNDQDFLAYLKDQFRETGVPPHKICLEITETVAVTNLAVTVDLMHELKQMGCRFALDDFGSGYASYSYLKNLPADYLKLDGEFIRDLQREGSDEAMVKSIHELSHHLGKLTVAEYIETASVRDRLTDIGIDFGQGYAIERPLPLDELGLKPGTAI